ncbi:MAG TPA: endo-1,4-beta-xylanase, partial [Anaerolineales bacterium]|nr:endo-1,4-beta-xylanase [Anaerolineales bacterium]
MNNKINPEIRKNRMAEATLTVLKADKTPLANQEVTVEQVRHKFLFGTAAFDLVPLTNGGFEGQKKEVTDQWVEKFLALCNSATLPFYWARFEPERGKPLTKETQNAARWCLDHGLVTKGHPLCWHTLTADWLLQMSNEEILRAQIARIQRDVADFRGLIEMWDVLNEGVIMPVFDKYDNGITRLCKEKGRIQT